LDVVKIFLPSIQGTKLSFLRDILSEEKRHLKQNEVIQLEVPSYQELSVKALYDDAMNEPTLKKYLPSRQQLSGKLPERDFFFGVLCTLKQQYMRDIIDEASKKRFKIEDADDSKKGILISDKWMEELMKHPYHSSKQSATNTCRETGYGHLPHEGASQALQRVQEAHNPCPVKEIG
jgi:hypothetical protein